MDKIAYTTTAGFTSSPINGRSLVLANIPSTGKFTATYADQAAGYAVIMGLSGVSRLIIGRQVRRELQNMAGQDARLEDAIDSCLSGIHFPLTVDGLAEVTGRQRMQGWAQPVTFDKVSEIPDYFMEKYLPIQRLTQYVTVIDHALSSILWQYLKGTDKSELIDPESFGLKQWEGGIEPGVVIRALLPENAAVQRLYTHGRFSLTTPQGVINKTLATARAHYKNGKMAQTVAPYLEACTQDAQNSIEALLSVLDNTMPLLPFEIYDRIVARSSFLNAIGNYEEIQKGLKRTDISPVQRQKLEAASKPFKMKIDMIKTEQNLLQTRLSSKFMVDPTTMNDYESHIEAAIEFFGARVEFIRKIFAKEQGQA